MAGIRLSGATSLTATDMQPAPLSCSIALETATCDSRDTAAERLSPTDSTFLRLRLHELSSSTSHHNHHHHVSRCSNSRVSNQVRVILTPSHRVAIRNRNRAHRASLAFSALPQATGSPPAQHTTLLACV